MTTRSRLSWALLAGLFLLAGCQRLNMEKKLRVASGEVHRLHFDAPRSEQKVTAQVSSPGAPVSVYLVRESDSEATQDLMMQNKAPTAPLAGKDKAEDITLEATVPAKTGFALFIRADKKEANVTVKVAGR